MPRITVLMSAFGTVAYLAEAIKSFQKQTFSDWEMIVLGVDDDWEAVNLLVEQDPRVHCPRFEDSPGWAIAMNRGIEMAMGDYIAFADAKDYSEPERLHVQLNYMEEHPEIWVCASSFSQVSQRGCRVYTIHSEPNELKAALLFPNEILFSAAVLRKEMFLAQGLRLEPENGAADYAFWLEALKAGAVFGGIQEPLVTHRELERGGSASDEEVELSRTAISAMGVHVYNYYPELFSRWDRVMDAFAQKHKAEFLQQGFQLLQEIEKQNDGLLDGKALRKVVFERWDWIRKSCLIDFEPMVYGRYDNAPQDASVSVLIPIAEDAEEICRTIDSIQKQTLENWELVLLCGNNSTDGTVELARMYAANDSRVWIMETEKSSRAAQLNEGIRQANGRLVAFAAVETMMPDRLEIQSNWLDAHQETGICGGWQKNEKTSETRRTAEDDRHISCRMLFECELLQNTVMIRRESFLASGLAFLPGAQADYDLWARAVPLLGAANLPHVVAQISKEKTAPEEEMQALAEESGRITAGILERTLGMEVPVRDQRLLNSWINPVNLSEDREGDIARLRKIFEEIWQRNRDMGYYDPACLLETLAAKWKWIAEGNNGTRLEYQPVKRIEDVFRLGNTRSVSSRYRALCTEYPSVSARTKYLIKKYILHWPAVLLRKLTKTLFKDCLSEIDRSNRRWSDKSRKQMESSMKAEAASSVKKVESTVRSATSMRKADLIPYGENERIRIMFLFQAASLWPNWESFYRACLEDPRISVVFAFLDELYGDVTQMLTARQFLEENKIPYVVYSDNLFSRFDPHVLIMQTPYDFGHRKLHVRSAAFKKKGTRIVYIPYGIELADTEHARDAHFYNPVVRNAWRVFTFSERMREDYRLMCPNYPAVKCVGHPKFDALCNRELFPLQEEIVRRAKGRKILVWHVHFPKLVPQPDGSVRMSTPELEIYLEFAHYILTKTELFTVLQPHPKFLDAEGKLGVQAKEIVALFADADNAFVDWADDYRSTLLNCDWFISDRSALMIEAAATGVPILYMSNRFYSEPLTPAIQPIMDSYYQGLTFEDMKAFVEQCERGEDPLKEQRIKTFQTEIPYLDGKCGERIKDHIVDAIQRESIDQTSDEVKALREELRQLTEKVDMLLEK